MKTFPTELREDLLYLVVFGPGYGESIAVRVPPSSWLIVDSLTAEPDFIPPALAMMTEHGASWSALILTHPHEDHAAGWRALLDSAGEGPVGCALPYVPPATSWTHSDDAKTHLERGTVEDALAAVQYRWETEPESRWELVAGSEREFGDARVRVLHPDQGQLDAAAAGDIPGDRNELASPVLVEWHDVRLLLGSDLPRRGWSRIAKHSSGLAAHHALKVAHHGSKGALHDSALKGPGRTRLWVATPFFRGRGLPCFDDKHGIAGLLKHNDEIVVTSLRDIPTEGPAKPPRLTRQHIRDARGRAAKSVAGTKAKVLPRPGMDPEGWVAAGFSKDGTIVDVVYGNGAVLVGEDAAAVGVAGSPPARRRSRGTR